MHHWTVYWNLVDSARAIILAMCKIGLDCKMLHNQVSCSFLSLDFSVFVLDSGVVGLESLDAVGHVWCCLTWFKLSAARFPVDSHSIPSLLLVFHTTEAF